MSLTKQQHTQAVNDLCIAPAAFRLRKITDAAHNRMPTRTAKGQRADALDELAGPAVAVPDSDDSAANRAGVLT